MLFGTIDAWHYFRRTGRYSDGMLRSKNLSLAREENFPGWKEWPLGHILFVSTTGSVVSWIVMYATDGPMSHTAMIYGDGVVHDVTSVGIHRHSIADYFDRKSYICVVPPPQGTDLNYARQFMDRTLGAKYNYAGVLRLGFNIAIGNNPSFSWRLTADILLLLSGVGLSIYLYSSEIPKITLGIAVTYAALTLTNLLRKRKRGIRRAAL